jgi:hypothetical protein
MEDNKLVDEARAIVTVVGSDVAELTYEQLRGVFLRLVPQLIAEIEILSLVQMQLPKPRKTRRKGGNK